MEEVEYEQPKAGLLYGTAFSGRAVERHHNLVLKVFMLLLIGYIFYQDHSWRAHADKLSEQQWVVFATSNDGETRATSATEFRTGASDAEVRNRAWEISRWLIAAGSENADTAFAEARKMMTDEMRTDFDAELGTRRQQLKELGIYRKIENAKVRPMEEKDLPPGARQKITRYDVVVSGTLDTYRQQTGERIATGPFAYHIRLAPLDKRTTENPWALLVESMTPLQLSAEPTHDGPAPPKQPDIATSPDQMNANTAKPAKPNTGADDGPEDDK